MGVCFLYRELSLNRVDPVRQLLVLYELGPRDEILHFRHLGKGLVVFFWTHGYRVALALISSDLVLPSPVLKFEDIDVVHSVLLVFTLKVAVKGSFVSPPLLD